MAHSTSSVAPAATPAPTSDATASPSPSTPAYYAVIPADVRYHPDLTANAKLLYGEITALCQREGFCWATNQYFADLYGVKVLSIKRWIAALVSAGFIETEVNAPAGNTRRIYLVSKKIPGRISKDTTSYQKRYEGRIKNDTHSITRSITKNNTKNPESLPAAVPEKTPDKIQDKTPNKTPAPDPLAALSDTDYAELEQTARAQLLAETSPPVSTSLLHGKSQRIVKARMRQLLGKVASSPGEAPNSPLEEGPGEVSLPFLGFGPLELRGG